MLPQIVVPLDTYPPKDLSGLPLLFIGHTSLWQCWPSAAKSSREKMKSAVLVSVLVSKKVVIVDAPKGTTSSSTEENLGFWIDEATKIVTLADGKKLNVGRFDDRWISAVSGDVSYELDRQSGNLAYAGSTMKDGIATTIIGAGRCTVAAAPAR